MSRDPRDLYRFDPDALARGLAPRDLVLVHTLGSMIDAGNACRISGEYLRANLRHQRIVSFDMDELIDYRGTRPQTIFDGRSFTEVRMPEISISLMWDEAGKPFLFMDGPEPDLQWNRMADAVIELIEYFEVSLTVAMHAIPMTVPHTRPIGLIAHANDPSLLANESSSEQIGDAEMHIPAGFNALLEHRLGQHGLAAMGYAAQIPHYLARSDFPAGALALLRRVSDAAGLEFPLVDLGDAADSAFAQLDQQVEEDDEARQIVTALEEQYDAMTAGEGPSILSTTPDMPTADEIADHFERFLAEHDDEPSDAQPQGPDGPSDEPGSGNEDAGDARPEGRDEKRDDGPDGA